MKRTPHLLLLAFMATAASGEDLARFNNYDQLSGSFQGITPAGAIVWQRPDFEQPATILPEKLLHIALRSGCPAAELDSLSSVTLIDGDRIPARLDAIGESHFSFTSPVAGAIKIPRDQIAAITPSPFGGRVAYFGPFSRDGWKNITPEHPDGITADLLASSAGPQHPEDNRPADDRKKPIDPWRFTGSAWVRNSRNPSPALLSPIQVPEKASIRFRLDWKNNLSFVVAFHADLARPTPRMDDHGKSISENITPSDPSYIPAVFGNCFALQINQGYLQLYRMFLNEDGRPVSERLNTARQNYSNFADNSAAIEIRVSRPDNTLTVFVDGEAFASWAGPEISDPDNGRYFATGSALGFLVQQSGSAARISDMIISEWNGMPDSARSMDSQQSDIVLMTNGTERFAGKVTSCDQGRILLKGKYADFSLPLSEISEIRFAKSERRAAPERPSGAVTVRFSPTGSITGTPLSATSDAIELDTTTTGKLNVSLKSAIMLDYAPSHHLIDDWDASF